MSDPVFTSFEEVPGLRLPFGVEDCSVYVPYVVHRGWVGDPERFLDELKDRVDLQWDESVTESRGQHFFRIKPMDDVELFHRLERVLLADNEDYFGLDLTYWHACNLNRYLAGQGGHMAHSDLVVGAKLAFSLPLVAPDKGGRLRLNSGPEEIFDVGDLVVFPGYEIHEVEPVEEGERISLTGWLGGPTVR